MSVDNTDVKYTLILEGIDRLESGMKNAKHHTDALGESMGHLKGMVLEVVGAYMGFEVLKESLGEWEKHKVAVAELSQMYANNSDHIKMNVDELKELAEQTQHLTGIHSEEAMAAETNLMKYKDLKISYEELIPLAADMGMKLGGIESASNMLGRALENPQKAMRLLVQAGVSPAQQKMYENLAKTGHAAQAQAYLIDLLKEKYQGLAKAAFDADPTAQLAEGFKQVKESIGELIEKGLIKIMPYLKSFMNGIIDVVHWIEKHKALIKDLIIVFGTLATAYIVYNGILKISTLITEGYAFVNGITLVSALTDATMAQLALDAAMDANPIGIVILAVAALSAALIILYNNYKSIEELHETQIQKNINNGLKDETEQLEIMSKALQKNSHISKDMADQKAIAMERQNLLDEESALIMEKKASIEKAGGLENWLNADDDSSIGKAKSVLDLREASITGRQKALVKGDTGKKGKDANPLVPESNSDKVSGTKQVIINVSINKLVETIKIEAQNIKDGVNSAGSDVARALLDAVNQFSASTDI